MHLLTAAALGRPLLLFTQSLGPFRSSRNRAFVRRLLPQVELLLARDELSARHVAEANVLPRTLACASDSVFALANEQRLRQAAERTWPRSRARIAVSVRAWKHFSHGDTAAGMERYRRAVAAGIAFLVREKSAQVTFISTCRGMAEYKVQDSKVAEAICDLLPEDVRRSVVVDHNFRTPEALIAKLSEFDLVVATRMHAAILSLVAGTPVLPIAYEFKTKELFDSLGWGDWVLDIESLDGELVGDRLSSLLVALPGLRGALFREVEKHRRSALEAARLMREALERAKGRIAG
jgi:colanic acid/amylovoran biosynthesis protein